MNIIVTFLFMLLDVVTGLIKALKTRSFNSSIMKEGMFSKSGSILLIILGLIGEYSINYIDLGITVPLVTVFCGYISLMEIGSIIENIGQLNPDILPNTIKQYFIKLKGDNKE